MSRRWRVLRLILGVIAKMRFIVNNSREKMKHYCCLFPNEYEFEREKLVRLWMAMGFSSQSCVENFCERYFDTLLEEQYIVFSSIDTVTWRNLYKVNHQGKGFMGEKKAINKEDRYTVLEDEDENGSKLGHISVVSNCINETTFQKFQNFDGELRTLLFIHNYGSTLNKIPSDLFLTLEFLQALDVSGNDIFELPSSIGNVSQLRYLDLSFTLIESLPKSIDQLRQLQTLKLQGCRHLHELPRGIIELICLRHLDLDVLGQLTSLPKGIGALTELCMLSAFIVHSEEGCTIQELKFLNKLRGSFCISGLENVAQFDDVQEAALQDKKYLTHLQLRWSDLRSYRAKDEELGCKIISSLNLNKGLQDLQIVCYPGLRIPAWVNFREQQNLLSVTLLNCNNNDLSLPLGQLPNLKYLSIIHMNQVTKIDNWFHGGGDEAYVAFPKLESLKIECMLSLETWIDVCNHDDFPFLSTLIIKQCPKLIRLPFLAHFQVLKFLEISDCTVFKCLPEGTLPASLETLIINDCPFLKKRCSKEGEDWHKVKHIPNIWIDLQNICSTHEDGGFEDSSSKSEDICSTDEDISEDIYLSAEDICSTDEDVSEDINPFFEGSEDINLSAVQKRMTLVEWINTVVPHFYLSVKASDEEMRASLLDGDILIQILYKLKYISSDEVDDSSSHLESRKRKIQRFLTVMSEIGLPTFEMSDLEKGSIKPVLDCLLALKEHSMPHFGSSVLKVVDERRKALSDPKFQLAFLPLSAEPPTKLLHGGNKLHRVFQMKQGSYSDLPATKISEMLKSNSLYDASTQSLLSVINVVLDESIEKKNAEIPQRVACTLRKVVQEIKQRIATQEDYLRAQSNLFKAREEKYQSRIKILEALAKGTSEESEIVMNQLRNMKSEKNKMEEEMKRLEHQDSGVKLNKLEKAAQSYHEVLNENRKIYNELQDLKGNIRVFCRIRPLRSWENQKQTIVDSIGEHGELTVSNPAKPNDALKSFKFNKVYGPMATQGEVFSDTQPLIRTILDGYNVCIFAYGQTGSGKTYTMSGPDNASKEDWGVNYRALDDLFQVSEDRRNFFSYEIGVQMIEIYNEQIRDLLSSDGLQKKLGILATPQAHGLAVPDASMHPVTSTEDVIELMNIGLSNRSVSSTAMNERSSRSHSVVTIHVQGTELKTRTTSHGSLHLVDLAGSERIDRSEATGDRVKEAQHINKSLSALGDVIFSLAQKNPYVPYRNSKLTQVLQSSLGGRAKTLMFVQVNPDVDSYPESLSTLKFAERVSGVELGAARSNKEGKDVKDLMDQVASLKDTIAKKEEEIERLKDPRSPSSRRNLSSLKSASSPPTSKSFGSIPRNPIARHLGILAKSVSQQDQFSDHISFCVEDDIDEIWSVDDSQNFVETSMSGGNANNDERLSELSDGDLSSVTYDGTLEGTKQRPTRPTQPSRLATRSSRLSQVKTTLKAASASKKSASTSSSAVTPFSGRRRM